MIYLDNYAKIFLGDDEMDPELMQFQKEGDEIIATNKHMLLKAPVSRFTLKHYKNDPDYIDWRKVMPKDIAHAPLFSINANDIIYEYGQLEKDMLFEDCAGDEGGCRGDACEICGGSRFGKFKAIQADYYKNAFAINGVPFTPDILYEVAVFAKLIGFPVLAFHRLKPLSAAVIKIDSDIMVVIMPRREENEDGSKPGIIEIIPIKEK